MSLEDFSLSLVQKVYKYYQLYLEAQNAVVVEVEGKMMIQSPENTRMVIVQLPSDNCSWQCSLKI